MRAVVDCAEMVCEACLQDWLWNVEGEAGALPDTESEEKLR